MLVQTEACLCALIWKQPIKPVIRETAVLWMLVCMYTVNAIVSFFFFFFNCLFLLSAALKQADLVLYNCCSASY